MDSGWDRQRRRWCAVARWAVLVALVGGVLPARAERGALSPELALGWGIFRVTAPGLGGQGSEVLLSAPAGRLAAAYALTHGLELGLAVELQLPDRRRMEPVSLRGRSGTFVETVTSGGLFALLRLAGLGLVRRAFLELSPGMRFFHHAGRDHLRPPVPPATTFTSYSLGLSAVTELTPALGLALGWFWSGDRLNLGLRGRAELAYKEGGIAPSFGLQLFTSWSFYP